MERNRITGAAAAVGIALTAALVIAVIGIVIAAGRSGKEPPGGESSAETTGAFAAQPSSSGTEKWQEGVISYNGKNYRYNTKIKTYLFMGIDREGPVEPAEDGISGGQSDAMFLLVQNNASEMFSVIAINRNAMAELETYDREGNYTGQQLLPICLQHGYGDGMRVSCNRSVSAVSNFFYGIPIHGYVALNMGGIPKLNDLVGGVTVVPEEDIVSESLGVSLKEGESVKLTGTQAYAYLRVRDNDEFESATKRLERQKQYINSLIRKLKQEFDAPRLLKVFDGLSDYLVTSVNFADLAEAAKKYDTDPNGIYSIEGRMYMGLRYEEFHVDDDALYELILKLFYEQVGE